MPLEKSPSWTELYYQVVEHYFWRPQAIGRKANPKISPQPWVHWKLKLQKQETPLNHILNFLFHIAPQELLDQAISALTQRQLSNLELVTPTQGTINNNIVQPDIIVCNLSSLVFIEMKVDSQSSIDQFAKYAIAAHSIAKDEPTITTIDLVLLSKHTEHGKIWKNSRKLGLTDTQSLRNVAISGLLNDGKIWGERGVKRHLKHFPESVHDIAKHIDSMGVHLSNYETLGRALSNYAAEEKTVGRLIEGVLAEFEARGLLGSHSH
jgi:hypothetical protein